MPTTRKLYGTRLAMLGWASACVLGAGFALAAADGNFNETVEPVTGKLPTTALWPPGRHTLFVRGRDAANNWGPVSAVFVDVE